ncbi:CLUMA_CG014914, isoform A [Clunio marinus]|uniref:CLUMA_CG014914, isoform A n=1 Tax=Clunio marinus TaxID=568069 RepID=A0A1J1IPQ4_9DIPT|nr:CLUMA_CG014914, isoform A [Clunio marinus]
MKGFLLFAVFCLFNLSALAQIDDVVAYCMKKFVIDGGFINVGDININPNNIDTATANCETLLNAARAEAVGGLESTYKGQNLPQAKVDCILKAFGTSKMFEYSTALLVLENLPITSEAKQQNAEVVQGKMAGFNTAVMGCFMA